MSVRKPGTPVWEQNTSINTLTWSLITPGTRSTHLRCPVHQPRRDHSSRIVKVVHKHCNMIQNKHCYYSFSFRMQWQVIIITDLTWNTWVSQKNISGQSKGSWENSFWHALTSLINLRGISRLKGDTLDCVNQTNINEKNPSKNSSGLTENRNAVFVNNSYK